METKINKETVFKAVVIILLIFGFIQTCSVRTRITEVNNRIQTRFDSTQVILENNKIENINNQLLIVTSIQELTNASNVTNKQKVIDSQTETINKLKKNLDKLSKEKKNVKQ